MSTYTLNAIREVLVKPWPKCGATLGYAFCAGLCSFKTVKSIVEGTL